MKERKGCLFMKHRVQQSKAQTE